MTKSIFSDHPLMMINQLPGLDIDQSTFIWSAFVVGLMLSVVFMFNNIVLGTGMFLLTWGYCSFKIRVFRRRNSDNTNTTDRKQSDSINY